MRKYRRIAILGIMLSSAGLGCSVSRESPFVSQDDARINIEVTNFAFEDATLYAFWPGKRVRLGIVTGTRTGEFMFPWDSSDMLRIEIDLLASDRCTTRPISVSPGDVILLEIHPGLRTCDL